jgi:oligopeptide transport system ATP-binding protein
MDPAEMHHLLDVRRLETRFYTNEGVVSAVNGVSYTLDEGKTLAIVGESGCGKSVSVLSILRLIPDPPGKITGGEVFYKGKNLLEMDRKGIEHVRGKEIGMIFQDPMTSLNPVLTIGRQMTEVLEYRMGLTRGQARSRAVELLEMVNIPFAADRIDEYPHQFSGGMRQRVMIAIAISCQPRILIADEPTTALDVTIQSAIVNLVRRLRDELGMGVIWITHDLGVVAGLAEKVIVMYAGHIVEEGPVREIYKSPSHPYTIGLLGSVPRVDRLRRDRLTSIRGVPPDQTMLPKGCAFAPRCDHVVERCLAERPPLTAVGPEHSTACWADVRTMSSK